MGVWLLKGYHGHPIYHLLKESEAPWKWPTPLGLLWVSASVKLLRMLEAQKMSRWWFQHIFYFHPRKLGKISNLTSIFFKWVETTNQKRCCSQSLGKQPPGDSSYAVGDQTSSPYSLEVADNTIENGSRELTIPKRSPAELPGGCFLMCLLCCHPKWEHTPREAP